MRFLYSLLQAGSRCVDLKLVNKCSSSHPHFPNWHFLFSVVGGGTLGHTFCPIHAVSNAPSGSSWSRFLTQEVLVKHTSLPSRGHPTFLSD